MDARTDDGGLAAQHALALLASLGVAGDPQPLGDHPALAWRRAGLMRVTGRADGPGLVAPAALTAAADGALAALRALVPDAALPANGASLLGERAARLRLTRRGDISPNGSCRLLATRHGGLALSLPRADDWELLPALFGASAGDWTEVARQAAGSDAEDLVMRGRELGLAIAVDSPAPSPQAPFRISRFQLRERLEPPLVVDLSSLWAGPLAGSLLAAAGARVIKVESVRRPDGARRGEPGFFDLLNGGKDCVALDLVEAGDVARLHALLAAADIVVEASRPRALAQLGVDAEALARAGAVWVSITAYGREGEAANHIGFGDDAAVAGGLSAAMRTASGERLFAGDAIADPLTGITAALAAQAAWRVGGGAMISLALSEVVAHAMALTRDIEVRAWQAMAEADDAPLYPLRAASTPASGLGADNAAVFASL